METTFYEPYSRGIFVEPYNPKWVDEFVKIRDYIWPHIDNIAIDIIHVGSTSVPGLAAKPIIDLVIIINSYEMFPQIVEQLKNLGYEHDGDGDVPTRERFIGGLRDNFMDYHMYVSPKDSGVLKAQIFFRDFLRQNNNARTEYAALKQKLAEKYRQNLDAYTGGKSEFILNILKTANSVE